MTKGAVSCFFFTSTNTFAQSNLRVNVVNATFFHVSNSCNSAVYDLAFDKSPYAHRPVSTMVTPTFAESAEKERGGEVRSSE